MARNVFISFLGTNNYAECRYQAEGFLSQPVRFVQEALIEYLCKDWTENDRILIFCTSKESTGKNGSKELNWLDDGQPRTTSEIERTGLKHRLDDLQARISLKPRIVEKDIKSGFTEQEIWDIFNTVFNRLEKDDRIYFDVTHAFRSIPLFATVLFNYARFMLGTQLVSIHYGAFEQLGGIAEAKAIPVEERIAPLIDLTSIVRLQEYNQIASSLKDFGKVAPLSEAIGWRTEDASDVIRDLMVSIKKLDEYIATIDIPNIKEGTFITTFRQSYRHARRNSLLSAPVQKILDELNKETEDFIDAPSLRNVEAAINWTIKHDMLMQTFPLVDEYLAMRVAEEFPNYRHSSMGKDSNYINFIKALLGMRNQRDFDNKQWAGSLAYFPAEADKLSSEPLVKELREKGSVQICEARNSLTHGMGIISYAQLEQRLPLVIHCMSAANEVYNEYPSSKEICKKYAP